MKNRLFFLYLILFLSCGDSFAAEVKKVDLDPLEDLVETWTGLRLEIANEKRIWKEQKAFLQQEQALLLKEIEALEAEKEEFEAFSSTVDQEQATLLQEKENLQAGLSALTPLLSEMEQALVEQNNQLPEFLQLDLQLNSEKRVVDRVQAVAAAFTQLESLLGDFHASKLLLPDDEGRRREVDVIYLGQALAFAVSTNDDWAGVGRPDAEAWDWQTRPNLAPQVRRLLEMLDGKQMPQFVEVPLQLFELEEIQP
ncbi:DUF3450 family protein [Kiritimatiellota bacterium B12222]|nr:DUF3450 family protein [Kiritimatiellota bacterium B12222]